MPKEIMKRSASDNEYLHRDFHCAMNVSLGYLDRLYGPDEVKAFIRRLASSYHAPLIEKLRTDGLRALKEHFDRIYQIEGGTIDMALTDDELVLRVPECPAIRHIEPYEDYCSHCDTLYRRVLEPLGYEYEIDLSQSDEAQCSITVRRPSPGKG